MNRIKREKLLFIWDGTKKSVRIADQFAASINRVSITAVHVMPHESICAYSTAGYLHREPFAVERRLRSRFYEAARPTRFVKHANFEVLLGDRIAEIVRLSQIIKAKQILLPFFQQSRFSSWMHGDLNERIEKAVACPVVFYDSEPNKSEMFVRRKGQFPNSTRSQSTGGSD